MSHSSIVRWTVFFTLALLVPFAPQTSAAQAVKPLPDYAKWPHEGSDLKPDPRILYGQLPNGMRYAIVKTTRPEGHAAIRLRISAGSLNESDKEQGLAHYLEHMAFQGSKNLTRNEFVQKLQRLGLSFGADTNASTSFDQTIYMLNLPRADAATLTESLSIIREVADRLTITPEAVEAERGVILSEERVRDTPGYRALKRLYADMFNGMKLPVRFPIGQVETIKAADAATIRGFYQRYYRPQRALLTVTGDFDVAAIEAQVKSMFGDWAQSGEMGSEAERGVAKLPALRAINFTDPSFPGSASINWVAAEPFRPSNRANEVIDIRRGLAQSIVNARLQRMAETPNPPFAGASIGCGSTEQGDGGFVRRCALSVRASGKGLAFSMAAAEQALRQSVNFPPDAGEIDRAIRLWRGSLEAAATGADTVATPDMANSIAEYFGDRAVLMHPKDYLALWEGVGPKLSAGELHAELKSLFGGRASLIFAQTATLFPGGEKALVASYEQSRAVAVKAPDPFVQTKFTYENFGTPGVVARRTEAADLGVTQVEFKNGVRLNIRPSQEEKGIVRTQLRMEGGVLSYPSGRTPFSAAVSWILFQGGLGKLTSDQLDGALAGDVLDNDWSATNANFYMVSSVKSTATLRILQTYAAYLTDAAYRPESLDQVKTQYARNYKGRTSTADNLLAWEIGYILSDDPRFKSLTPEETQPVTLADVKSLVAPALTESPLELTIAGDITVDVAIQAAARTLGALPARRALRTGLLPEGSLAFPARAKTVRLYHQGRADQALVLLAWPASDTVTDPHKARAGALAQSVLDTALTVALRDKGLTYSTGGGFSPSDEVKGYGQMSVSVETKPETLESVRQIILDQIKAIVAGDFSDDLLKRAREPEVSAREADLKSNEFWVDALSDSQALPSRLNLIRSRVNDFKTISRDDIVAAARDIFNDARRVEVQVLPAVKAN